MSELTPEQQQEFEFRLRLEKEQAAARKGQGQVRLNPVKTLFGLGETAAKFATEMGESAVAGLAGIAAPPWMNRADVVEKVQGVIPTYEPSSNAGKQISAGVAAPFEKMAQGGEWLADRTMQPHVDHLNKNALAEAARTGEMPVETPGPLAGTIARMVPDVALTMAGGVKPKPKAAPAAAPKPPARGTVISETMDLFRKGGPERILTRYQREKIGSPELQSEVIDALEGPGAAELVPGSKPTAAEALAKTPAGSPILAHQDIVAKTPGGPSAEFGKRLAEQEAARTTARKAVEDELGPVRDKILDDANVRLVNGKPTYRPDGKGGFEPVTGVDPTPVAVAMQKVRETPGLKGREVVQKTLDDIEARVSKAKNKDGLIDAHELYGIRKDLGEMIQKNQPTALGKPKPGSKRLATMLEKAAQHAIDEAIEAAGGKGWKETLKKYSDRLEQVDLDVKRAKAAKKPLQRTNVSGPPIGIAAKPESPNLLSRTAMFVNYLLKAAGRNVEPKIAAEAARRYLDPKALAEALRATGKPKVTKPPRRISTKGAIAADQGERAREMARLRAEALRQ